MQSGSSTIEELGRQAQARLREQPLRELANGLGIGLIFLTFAVWAADGTRQVPELDAALFTVFLVVVPLLHAALAAVALLALRRCLERQYAVLLEDSQLLLWIVSGSFPPELIGLASRIESGGGRPHSFSARVRSAIHHWRALSLAAGAAQPQIRLSMLAIAAACLWTLFAVLPGSVTDAGPAVYPAVFLIMCLHFNTLAHATAKNVFTLELVKALESEKR